MRYNVIDIVALNEPLAVGEVFRLSLRYLNKSRTVTALS